MSFTEEQNSRLDRASEATRALATRLGYTHPPHGMLEAHLAAQDRTRPTSRDVGNAWWPAAFERHRGSWSEVDDEVWRQDHDRMTSMVEAEQRHRMAKADASKASADEAAAAEKQRKTEEYDALVASIRPRFMSLPGTTVEEFDRRLPDLVQAERMRILDQQATADDIARRTQHARTRL